MNAENRQELADQFASEILACSDEWMRRMVVEIEDHPLEGREVTVAMHDQPRNGMADFSIQDAGRFRVTVTVEPLAAGVIEGPEMVWISATLGDVMAGDRIRIGQDETTVTRSNLGVWNVDTSDYWRPRAWQHIELRLDLEANPGLREYPADLACEVLCSPERLAVLRLDMDFRGTQIID